MTSADELVVEYGEVPVVPDVEELHGLRVVLLLGREHRLVLVLAGFWQGHRNAGGPVNLLFARLQEFTLRVLLLSTEQSI